jgi:hypothetical protein
VIFGLPDGSAQRATNAADASVRVRARMELERAAAARRGGREGRARVSARRAAGWSIAPFYRRATGETPPSNALALLRWLRDATGAPEDLRAAAARLTVPVDTDHRLPHQEDPLDDARLLVTTLAGEA